MRLGETLLMSLLLVKIKDAFFGYGSWLRN